MSIVKEMRERHTITPVPERSGLGATVLIGCAAFAIGALAIAGWKMWPAGKAPQAAVATVNQPAPASTTPAAAAPIFSGKRLGEAEQAPLLATCVADENFGGFGDVKNPQAAYALMKTVGAGLRIATLIGAETGNGAQLIDNWRIIAECVYRQNSWTLCNPDNRVLAIESAGAFVRGAAAVLADPPKGRGGPMVVREYAQARDRILDALRTRVRNGYLVADDFGAVQPPEIKAVLTQTKTVANGCTKQ
ncbi:MAG: hypothetical protein QOF14_3909 [Hyphomicrobiales bacterium]|jgi:hypothetical protein|nr:hypothetical protein [Hyphomicrobiales bacterium]